jgi:NAD(P)H-flavin reductase
VRYLLLMGNGDLMGSCSLLNIDSNCPKYINIRTLIPHPSTEPQIVYNTYNMEPGARLPKTVIDFITAADTIFVGTIYEAKPLDAQRFPSHAGMNARGGLPGFVRVKPSDGRTIIIPDYSGNRFMSSLGNIQASGLASMTIVSFSTGDVLYLTGSAQVLIGESALELMPRQATVCAIETTGFTLVRDAFPIRQAPATEVERSPYSPQIKYLREEPQALPSIIDAPIARLSNAVMVSEDIAILHFDVSYQSRSRLNVIPGQAIVLDFMDWMGLPNYQHMAANAPGSLNDDRVRTWTVSSGHEHYPVHEFDLTVREKKGGAVTGALFDVIRQHGGSRKYMQKMDFHALNISASVIGITGEFFLPVGSLNMLWVAGGIGVTPFIAMLAALSQRGSEARGELILALATREPTTFLRLIDSAMTKNLPNLRIQIDIFTTETAITIPQVSKMRTIIHKGHIQQSYWNTVAQGKDVYICGPAGFGDSAVDGLRVAGVASEKILREGFF